VLAFAVGPEFEEVDLSYYQVGIIGLDKRRKNGIDSPPRCIARNQKDLS
jgi:hypothetical protein